MMQNLQLPKTQKPDKQDRSKSASRNFWKALFLLVILSAGFGKPGDIFAQTPGFSKTGTGTSGNTIPLNQTSQKTQLLYAPADFGTTPTSGFITKIYFRNSAAAATATYTDFQVSFLQNNDAAFANTSFYTGLNVVHYAASQTVTANATAGGWFEIPLQAPYFQYDNTKSLIVEIQYTAKTGGISTTTSTSTGNKRVSGTSLTATTGTANTTWNDFGMDITPAAACTTPPTAGTATSNTTNLCAGNNFTLNLTGATSGTGLTYQWETSLNGTTGWTAMGTASPSPILTTSQTAGTHYYRAIATCSGQASQPSTVVSVTSPALITGNFTINNNAPASATNFQSFAAAINSLSCGIGGTVTFTVDPASGPYSEQIEIPAISGASATNKVIFQGNGRTISADPATGDRTIIRLNGADYITINNLRIETTGTSTTAFGWGIQFIGGADNNTISNNNIIIGSLSTTSSNSGGIVFSNSNSTITTVGNNGNNNVISGNTITGGYRGIRLNGTAAGVGNNQFINNTIKDFYAAGIEVDDANATLIEGNDISRPTRAVVTTFEGITLSGVTQNTVVNKNRIHNTYGGATTITGIAYGLYSNANDAPVGLENIFMNNLVYDFNNTGVSYGIHNAGSNGTYYYNNTINLDNTASTANTRGFYQTTAASNIKLINNNIVVNTGGAATAQHAIFLNIATTTVESNRNNLYVPNGNTGSYNATNYLTLTDWRTANGAIYDLNSVAADPFFVGAGTGNLAPTNVVLNNVGQPLAAVTTDFTGAPRNATTPDIGAYEFTPNSLDLGVTALVTPAAKNCFSNAEPVTVTVTNFGTSAVNFSTVTATVTVNVTGAATPAPISVQLTNALNGGQPLASGTTMNVLVGTVNMTTAGTYTFNASSAVTAGGTDGNAANNAMPAASVVVSPLTAGTASTTNAQLCLSGTTTLNLTGNSGGDIQWQSATSATGPFTNIAGATTASYTLASPINQTTYFQAVTSCGSNNATSNAVTVTVNNPTAPTVAAVSRCGAGPVTLTTTVPTGTTVRWYDAATGGSFLANGTTFSPNVTATTTYYATASLGGTTENVGIVNGGTSTFITATAGWGLRFTATQNVTINSVNVYATGTGTITIKITDLNDAVLYTAQPVTISGATTSQKLLIPVNLTVPPGNYKMGMSYTGITTLVRESSGVSFPYTSPSGAISITAGANGTGTASTTASYYWFYDWSISTGCESVRIPVTVTVNPLPATPTITKTGNTLTSSAATGNQWYLNGTAIPGATGQTFVATANGNYTVVTTGANNCPSAASAAVVVNIAGIVDNLSGMSVQVYPNPATGSFNVKLNGYQQAAKVVLYNLAGQVITEDKVSADGNAKNINIKNMAAGTYLLKVTSEKGVQVTRLIVQ